MNRVPQSDADVANAASVWLARHDRGLSAAETRDFGCWLDADPRHAVEFARLQGEWGSFDLIQADSELVAQARRLDDATRPVLRRRPLRRAWSGWQAASAAVVVLVGLAWWSRPAATPIASTQAYEVLPSSARALSLADGSRVELRGTSEVAVDFTPAERRVRLLRGEAHFTVTSNPTRPFIVDAGTVAVRAVGTAFNVRLDSAAVELLVTEGKVQLEAPPPYALGLSPYGPTLVSSGERVAVPLGGAVEKPAVEVVPVLPSEADQMLSWQTTRLVFNRTPLGEAVEAFNRHGTLRLELGDASLRGRLLGGTFSADNAGGFVRLLEQGEDIRAEHRDDGTTVLWPVK